MYQQINLYQPVFRRQHKVFSSLTLLQISAAVLLLLVLISSYTRWTLAGMDATAQGLEQHLEGLGTRFGLLKEDLRTPDTEAIDTEVETLRKTIAQRKYLLQQLDQLVLQNRGGFASRFEALARLQVHGLWLEGVTVNDDDQMEIRGITLEPKLVPVYLQQLEEYGDLPGTKFETVSMTRIANDQPQIQFVLREGDSAWP